MDNVIYLQNFNQYDEIIELKITDGKSEKINDYLLSIHERKDQKIGGYYSNINNMEILFFRYIGFLNLMIDKKHFRITNDIKSKWVLKRKPPSQSEAAIFSLYTKKGFFSFKMEIYRVKYEPFINRQFPNPFAYSDDEDDDFLILVNNVLNDSKRCKLMFT